MMLVSLRLAVCCAVDIQWQVLPEFNALFCAGGFIMLELRNLTIDQGNAPLAGVVTDGESGRAAGHLCAKRPRQDHPGAGIGGLATSSGRRGNAAGWAAFA